MNIYQDLAVRLESEGLTFLNLHYTDIFGGFHTITVHINELSKNEISSGVAFDSSSVPGFGKVESGDMVLKPDLDTFFLEGFENEDAGGVLCDIVNAENGDPMDRCPRAILRRAEKILDEKLGAVSYWLPELEFFLFDSLSYSYNDFGAFFKIKLLEVMQNDGKGGRYKNLERKGGYHASSPEDHGFDFRNHLVSKLEENEINIKYHHHEVAGGQHEIELIPQMSLEAADNVVMVKYFAKKLASFYDSPITFMPKPLNNFPGNGMHFHQWLAKDDVSLFWDENADYAHISELGRNYIAGLLYHAPALTAFTNPSTNSFRRLVPGFEAPTKLFYGLANRVAAIRIPKYVDTPQRKRIEYRPPDPMANSYLAISAMMLAGLDGIAKKLDPTELGYGPFDDDVTKWNDDKQNKLDSLPSSLTGAADALLNDCEFLIKEGVFPDNFIRSYAMQLKNDELKLSRFVTPYEIAMYFGR